MNKMIDILCEEGKYVILDQVKHEISCSQGKITYLGTCIPFIGYEISEFQIKEDVVFLLDNKSEEVFTFSFYGDGYPRENRKQMFTLLVEAFNHEYMLNVEYFSEKLSNKPQKPPKELTLCHIVRIGYMRANKESTKSK